MSPYLGKFLEESSNVKLFHFHHLNNLNYEVVRNYFCLIRSSYKVSSLALGPLCDPFGIPAILKTATSAEFHHVIPFKKR